MSKKERIKSFILYALLFLITALPATVLSAIQMVNMGLIQVGGYTKAEYIADLKAMLLAGL